VGLKIAKFSATGVQLGYRYHAFPHSCID